jgi:hypothetical protein
LQLAVGLFRSTTAIGNGDNEVAHCVCSVERCNRVLLLAVEDFVCGNLANDVSLKTKNGVISTEYNFAILSDWSTGL